MIWMDRCRLRSILATVIAALALAFVAPLFAQSETDAKPAAPKPAGNDHGIPQVRRINEEIRKVWEDNKLRPSVAATDNEYCRRVYLDVLGRIPTVTELREFLQSKESDKKAKLVNKI